MSWLPDVADADMTEAPAPRKKIVAVGFDGVLHSFTSGWQGDREAIPDPPVPGAVDWLTQVAGHYTVKVVTTRARTAAGQAAVLAWLRANGLEAGADVVITDRAAGAVMFLDDRNARFQGRFPTVEQIRRSRPWRVTGEVPPTQGERAQRRLTAANEQLTRTQQAQARLKAWRRNVVALAQAARDAPAGRPGDYEAALAALLAAALDPPAE